MGQPVNGRHCVLISQPLPVHPTMTINTLAIGGPCRLCGRPNIEHGQGHCPPAVQWVADGVARVKARLAVDPEMAKALLPNMTHAEVKAALQKRPG